MELEKEKVEIPGTSTEHVDAVSITGGVPERPKGTKRMMLLGLYVGLTGWMYNFDLGYSGIVLQMMPFKEAFGRRGPIRTPAGEVVQEYYLTPLEQSLVSVAILFIAMGGALAGPLGQYTGRRGVTQASCALIGIGAGGMLGTSGSYLNYMVCKCIQGVGLESPRWLLIKNRELEARKSFSIYYGKPIDDPDVSYQIQQVQQHIELGLSAHRTSSFFDIFRGANLRRTTAAIIVVLGIAVTGVRFITTYATIFVAGIGIDDPYLVNVIMGSSSCLGTLFNPWVIEYWGRRFALLAGYAGLAVMMLLIAAVGSGLGQSNPIAQRTLVAFLTLWYFIFGFFVSASLGTISPEQHSLRLRTYGQAFTIYIYEIFAFGLSFSIPYMIGSQYGNMGLNVGYFFCGLSVILFTGCFFFLPETARLSLEQIDDQYNSQMPAWKTSLKKNRKIAAETRGF
ncbi:hypothetical protein B0A52_07272 [Exophiala mesophila]|uniref:Major facilitator superfamily (MFS) profile domain-containing protein n=1 Tax=Exophiala mesophila TaxID=212818 RepID=A0A438MZ42_EXOME|nr:hypothetical protein B0A52_07272 [Exophiala mesophila]